MKVVWRSAFLLALWPIGSAGAPALPGNGSVTLIHIGDIHGHLVSRPDARDTVSGRRVGGLARMFTLIEHIRARHPRRTLLLETGDVLQGSAEALFTRGQAVIDVLEPFGIDAAVPGNWDYVYGTTRFLETFAGTSGLPGLPGRPPLARWHALAANLYAEPNDARSPANDPEHRPLAPIAIRETGGVRVGLIGLTTSRGPRAVGDEATKGLRFTQGDAELARFVHQLRDSAHVDVVVVLSELELANNMRLAEHCAGVDVILSADMHERTTRPIVTSTGTVIVEEGQDGTVVGELTLEVRDGRVASWQFTSHDVTDGLPEDPTITRLVTEARRPFVSGPGFRGDQVNPLNGSPLGKPIDEIVGYAAVPLHRAGYAGSAVPAALEGSSHDFLTDAFRTVTGADIAAVRGFRFGTHVLPGPIHREDLYHFLPIGAQIGVAHGVLGADLRRQIEMSLHGTFDPDPRQWTGGWLFGFSGVTFDVDVSRPFGERASRIRVGGEPLDTLGGRRYTVAGLWFASEPATVNNCGACASSNAGVRVLRTDDGRALDAIEVVVRYLAGLGDSTARPATGRVRSLTPLPESPYGFPMLQPFARARANLEAPSR